MAEREQDGSSLLVDLQERAKELSSLYRVEEVLSDTDRPLADVLQEVVEALPPGWRFPDVCEARIEVGSKIYQTAGFERTKWLLEEPIVGHGETIGRVTVAYADGGKIQGGAFLKEEIKLLRTVADRVGHYVLHRRLRQLFSERASQRKDWQVALELLRKTDTRMIEHVARKMLNMLARSGVSAASEILRRHGPSLDKDLLANRPSTERASFDTDALVAATFRVAQEHLTDDEILGLIQKSINEEKLAAVVRPLTDQSSSLSDVCESLAKLRALQPAGLELPAPTASLVKVALVRRFFSEQLSFINRARTNVEVEDFFDLPDRLVFSAGSRGKLGGKAAGLFLAGSILSRAACRDPSLGVVRIPKSWYVTSDGLTQFLLHNDLEDLREQKYRSPDEVRQDYPRIVRLLKDSRFPPEIIHGLSVALDDLDEVPLVVRSSSLLEDQIGAAFSGKYVSLFLANQGSKQDRLVALLDAIAEVYASTFGPDPIEYRTERGLLDLNEEMGILIQEVVGNQVGSYFFPSFAGVAFSSNEFRWSPRIAREDGLVRMVPGLGTRAVDRLADDYPVLVAPGQPSLRVNTNTEEVVWYAPKKIDLIDLETGRFETRLFSEVVREVGDVYPALGQIVSVNRNGILHRPMGIATDYREASVVVTFDGLIGSTPFVEQLRSILRALEERLGLPVDVEFASDGTDLFLLQCRPQSHAADEAPLAIPDDIPPHRQVFAASRFISNGRVPDISTIVYVDPEAYDGLRDRASIFEVRETIGRLNKTLPRRSFILMGPGRWGSRGDIKLGVPVTYSEINNTAMLIEIARQQGGYRPDLSFGTHFFQDLVEASIRYLPLYPDEPGGALNVELLLSAPNRLVDLVPDAAPLSDVVRVIDVPASFGQRILRVLANADAERAVGILVDRSVPVRLTGPGVVAMEPVRDEHWRWRMRMAEHLAADLDPERFGVVALYIIGSTKNATAGPASDLDLVVHVRNDGARQHELEVWLDGWSRSLAAVNSLKTGISAGTLLDVHFVTDEDIERKTSYAVLIDAASDRAQELPLGGSWR